MKIRQAWVREHLLEAVEVAIAYGYQRAHKHEDHPTQDAICAAIADAVHSAIDDALEFDVGDEC